MEDKIIKNKNIDLVMPEVTKPKIRFYIKICGCTNTNNANGYKNWQLECAFFRSRYHKTFYTQILGNGDNGDRCNNSK